MNVLVTGASTGIGRATAVLLSQGGHRVFAGYRKDADGAALAALGPKVVPVRLEVTDEASIRAAIATLVEALGEEPLHGVVNNAGIGEGGPVEHIPLSDWRWQFEVNFFGPIALIQATLPLLRRGPGRIVNVSSIGGRVASPFMGPYCSSKFALEALTDSLRAELAPMGIQVTAVEPGAIATPIWDKAKDRGAENRQRFGEDAVARYGTALEARLARMMQSGREGIAPEKVAEAIVHALSASRAPTRSLVGTDARMGAFLKWLLPDRWFDKLLAGRG